VSIIGHYNKRAKLNKPNKDILLQLMLLNGLDRADVARLTNRKASTIRNWMSGAGRDMPDDLLALLKYRVGDGR